MSSIYSGVYSTIKLQGATLIPAPTAVPSSAFAPTEARPAPPAMVLLPAEQLIQLLPSLKSLATSSVVLQVSTQESQDHSQVLALRGSGLALLYSANNEQAKGNSLVAARVAATGRGVVHFGEFDRRVDFGTEGVTGEWIVARDGNTEEDQEGAPNGTTQKPTLSSLFSVVFNTLPAALATSASSYTGAKSPETLIVALGNTSAIASHLPTDAGLLSLNLYRPLSPAQIRDLVPSGVKTIVTLEQVHKEVGKWSPLFLDVVGAYVEAEDSVEVPTILSGTLGVVTDGAAAVQAIAGELCGLSKAAAYTDLSLYRCG